jgi:hypothetical protein
VVCVCSAHFDGLVGDASGILKGFQAGFGGVEERFVAEVAVDKADDVVDLLVARAAVASVAVLQANIENATNTVSRIATVSSF